MSKGPNRRQPGSCRTQDPRSGSRRPEGRAADRVRRLNRHVAFPLQFGLPGRTLLLGSVIVRGTGSGCFGLFLPLSVPAVPPLLAHRAQLGNSRISVFGHPSCRSYGASRSASTSSVTNSSLKPLIVPASG